jgi:LytS/YehU family sensor histidine kinase
VKISDNGVGFSEKKNDGHESLSLKIIHERLTSISKGKQKVNINSSKYIGTKVEFYIPLDETV